MSIRDDFGPYFDGNGLLAPNPVSSDILKGSDNGTMFLAEYMVMLSKSSQLTDTDKQYYFNHLKSCINSEGMLCRVPIGQDDGQEQVDNYYAAMNGCKQLKNVEIPRTFLKSIVKNLGFMDNENPGSHSNWASFMPRQPQLMAAMISAAFPSWLNPLHILIRTLAFPLYLVAAVSIFISCINTPANSADPRRLSWHLLQTVCPVSLMCKFASLFWYHRLYSVYGQAGMKGVAAVYYQPKGMNANPYSKYWVSE